MVDTHLLTHAYAVTQKSPVIGKPNKMQVWLHEIQQADIARQVIAGHRTDVGISLELIWRVKICFPVLTPKSRSGENVFTNVSNCIPDSLYLGFVVADWTYFFYER